MVAAAAAMHMSVAVPVSVFHLKHDIVLGGQRVAWRRPKPRRRRRRQRECSEQRHCNA
jgi:hypothetical protein